ncbi:class 1 fructose-bisphosphatase [Halostella litorea]|uniref:class 1 fructose-bisphosphatase n=1 Tax=Halostella litorea TaxID=2528831 RepID=UPI001091B8E9|nr:class 1 fructose-bisphosphatase [Halostella litorea]
MDTDPLIGSIARATEPIRERLHEYRRKIDAENPSGDTQVAADDWADGLFYEEFVDAGFVGEYASEERSDVVDVGDGYGLTIDPLDGSSNLLSNSVTGAAIGVYDAPLPARGRDLVAGAIVLFGSYTTVTVATDDGVTRHVVSDGRVVDRDPVAMPDRGDIYGYASTRAETSDDLQAVLDEVGRTRKVRYSGAMVADAAQLLTHGGVLVYPARSSAPEGDLRLQYESNPVAYIVERAGGASSDGTGSILDVEPTNLHQRTPTVLGSPELVDRVAEAIPAEQ